MTTPSPGVPEPVLAALQSSGFPFQTAVAQVINTSTKWKLHASEYPWQTTGGDSQFLNIVASNGVFFLTIECKKTRKDIYTFLRPSGPVQYWRRRGVSLSACPADFRWEIRIGALLRRLGASPGVNFLGILRCKYKRVGKSSTVAGKRCGSRCSWYRRVCARLSERFCRERDPAPPTACIFVPVIITNAPIYTARYEPSDISLESGEFSVPPREIDNACWVRFRKAFTSDGGPDLGDRSVFVVQATSFVEFLKQVAVAPVRPQDRAAAHYFRN